MRGRRTEEAILENINHVLSIALGARDHDTQKHSERVIGLSRALGIQISLTENELEVLALGARLHDIGKIGIPDHILGKPATFNPDEWECMKQHSEIGERIVQAIDSAYAPEVARIVRHHHEHFDGSGYPDGLHGTAIPLLARIVSLADCYDAMAMPRHYHPINNHRAVMEILTAEAGIKHDPDLLHAFRKVIDNPENHEALN